MSPAEPKPPSSPASKGWYDTLVSGMGTLDALPTGFDLGPVSARRWMGWRLRALDKLPFVGPLADAQALASLGDAKLAPRLQRLPRVPGLFGIGALAGRGFTWGPLAGELLASWIDGSVIPLESALVDALDPARLWRRREQRNFRTGPGQPARR
jgi:tRNA 5-methylaminomethyl-2-thiouridine biosynthesis bifunctional protein